MNLRFPRVVAAVFIGASLAIAGAAFFGCTSLKSIRIPGSVKSIGANAFTNCNVSDITLCNGIKTIGSGAFANCINVTKIVIPASVTSIANGAFGNCSSLSDVTVNYGVKTIGDSVFADCTSLKSITLPGSITKIGDYVFNGCSGLTVKLTQTLSDSNGKAWNGLNGSLVSLQENALTVTGKTATVKVKKKAKKIAASKLYTFTEPGKGAHLFAKVSGNKKITVASNGVITVKKGIKKGTYTVKVKVLATGDLEYKDSGWKTIAVKIKVK